MRLGPSEALVKPGTAGALDQLTARVLDLVHSRGCANARELVDDVRAIFGPNASSRFAEAALMAGGRFQWLDRDAKSFWDTGDHEAGSNRLIRQFQCAGATATPRIQLTRLRSAIRRDNGFGGFGGFAPPIKVLEFICRHLLFVRLDGDSIARIPGIAKLDQVLTSDERILVDVLQSHGPVVEHEAFLEHCRKRGLDETSFSRLTSNSLILDKHEGMGYMIVGAALPTAAPQNVGKPRDGNSTKCKYGFLSEGLLFLAWKLHANAI